MPNFLRTFPLLLSGLLLSASAGAIEFYPRMGEVLQKEGRYLIYPAGKRGNGLYQDQVLLTSNPDEQILKVHEVEGLEDTVVYLYRNRDEALRLKVGSPGESKHRLRRIGEEFYEVLDETTRALKLFRIFRGTVDPLLNRSRTATGLTPSETHAVFYNITASEMVTIAEGDPFRLYTFRLHLLHRERPGFVSLRSLSVQSTRARLDFQWVGPSTITFQLGDGTPQQVDLRDYAPNLFSP